MHKARAFLLVCAGIFLLALAYHLGARSAGAQAGAPIVGACSVGLSCMSTFAAVDASGGIWYRNNYTDTWKVVGSVPGRPVALDMSDGAMVVTTDSGQIYSIHTTPCEQGGWTAELVGSPVGGATEIGQRVSIGQLKAKYAAPKDKAGQATGDR